MSLAGNVPAHRRRAESPFVVMVELFPGSLITSAAGFLGVVGLYRYGLGDDGAL